MQIMVTRITTTSQQDELDFVAVVHTLTTSIKTAKDDSFRENPSNTGYYFPKCSVRIGSFARLQICQVTFVRELAQRNKPKDTTHTYRKHEMSHFGLLSHFGLFFNFPGFPPNPIKIEINYWKLIIPHQVKNVNRPI